MNPPAYGTKRSQQTCGCTVPCNGDEVIHLLRMRGEGACVLNPHAQHQQLPRLLAPSYEAFYACKCRGLCGMSVACPPERYAQVCGGLLDNDARPLHHEGIRTAINRIS